MSLLQIPGEITTPNQKFQTWRNNAIFLENDTDETPIKSSWSSLQPILTDRSNLLQPDLYKENRSPESRLSSCDTPNSLKPLTPLSVKPLKPQSKQVLGLPSPLKNANGDQSLSAGIEEIEREIQRLTSRLAELKLQQAAIEQKRAKGLPDTRVSGKEPSQISRAPSEQRQPRPGRIVAAKFMEQKQSPNPLTEKSSAQPNRRRLTFGPSDLIRFRQELAGKPDVSPFPATQSRRKSCYSKLPEIKEENGKKEIKPEKEKPKGSRSLSPKPRKSAIKPSDTRQGISTVGSKQPIKRTLGNNSHLPSKNLFNETPKKPAAKKPTCRKSGREVASRYSKELPEKASVARSLPGATQRKRSLPENEPPEDEKRGDKKRVSLVKGDLYNGSVTFSHGKSQGPDFLPENRRNIGREIQMARKRWSKPCDKGDKSEKITGKGRRKVLGECPPSPISSTARFLPKIKTVRSTAQSPRDSGCVKRTADGAGKKTYFTEGENEEPDTCQVLCFNDWWT
ncbi:uncharacterized protein LOC18431657 isoform X2 [Amborella trichopoda]|uniref:uncharacterized protein LOC18431657 isoform X2 n=1 Tax=Amborella trichopoda TaxID=13333 RepID=UPI0009BFC7CF|nr:uncharacterized protein LOC18431657 isoform X2 [Amborella trichopoda]|eukprot:XP_020521035.1 uncharacterized protein LOC18431657 isoform X2 [Amborella trichopoda]